MKNLALVILSIFAFASLSADARSYSIKLVGSGGKGGSNDYLYLQDKSKRIIAELTIGRPSPKENLSPIEIRAATVFKDINTKKAFVNDITKESFTSTNSVVTKFIISSGAAGKTVDRDAKVGGGYDFSHGYTVSGVIVEIWQGKKCLKHLSNIPGKDGKTSLADGTAEALLNEDDNDEYDIKSRTAEETAEYKASDFKNHTIIRIRD